jgi:hypothetical protein
MTENPSPAPAPSRLVRTLGCLVYPVGFGIVVALALYIKSLV